MIEKIEKDGVLIAMILRGNYEEAGVHFFTGRDNPLQVGVLNHKKGTVIKSHLHKCVSRNITQIQEVLHVERGVVEVLFYDNAGAYFGSNILNRDDTVLLISGGHGLIIQKDAMILEVKQGPYLGVDEDKKLLPAETKGTNQ